MEIHGCFWDTGNKIESMIIPGGLRVHLYTELNYRGMALGPYDGPQSIPKIDARDSKDSSENPIFVQSLKIVNLLEVTSSGIN